MHVKLLGTAIIALLNDARLMAGQPPLGFLNPFLYQAYASRSDAFIGLNNFQ